MTKGVTMNAIATTLPTRGEFVERISALWHRSREYILALGRALIEAKAALDHGEFTAMIESDLPFGPDNAQRFMRIAKDPKLSNPANSQVLPSAVAALEALTDLQEDQFEEAVQTGEIHPRMTTADAKALIGHPREPTFVAPRAPEALRSPIINRMELLATMKGYRSLAGQSQLEADFSAGWPEGYTGKLEIDTRRAINDSWWEWMGSRLLVMLLVPAVDACKPDRCPCCGQITP